MAIQTILFKTFTPGIEIIPESPANSRVLYFVYIDAMLKVI